MKLLIAAVTFAATLGMLFLIEAGKSPKEDYARIIEALKEGNVSAAVSATPSLTKARPHAPTLSTQDAPVGRQTSTPAPTQISTGDLSPTPLPISPSPSPASSTTPTPTSMPSSPPQESGQGSINITSVTSPVEQNSTAQLSISTLPDAQCSIKVTLPSGNQSSAKGLETKTADASGNIIWSWKINWNTTIGTATIEISCSKDGQSFSKSLQMTIIAR